MSHKRFHLLITLLALVLAMLACGIFSGGENEVIQEVSQPEESLPEVVEAPTPESAQPEPPPEPEEDEAVEE